MTEPVDTSPDDIEVEPLMGYDRTIDDIGAWIRYGVERGWISEPACATHDGIPTTPDEDVEWDEGYDPCQPVLRLWPEDYAHGDDGHFHIDTEPLEGPVKIEIQTVLDNTGEHEIVTVDGEMRDANIQVITAIGGKKVIFLDGQQVKDGEVWRGGVLMAKVTPE